MEYLIQVKNLTKHFPIKKGILFSKQVGAVQAVDNVNFNIKKGETLGMVGESGCGKSTIGRLILRLLEPTKGDTIFNNKSIYSLKGNELRNLRKELQIIFQDPYASLNPRMTIGDIIAEPLIVHKVYKTKAEINKRVRELLNIVGLLPSYSDRYPHEFSGGQRQRIGIARAIALNPQFIVADEPVSALDVSIQAQVLNLLKELQKELKLTYLFIAHNLSTVKHISDRVAVMYLGKMVELATSKELYANTKHPYTQALMSAIPIPDPNYKKNRIILQGDVPNPINPPSGCRFNTRCNYVMEICKEKEPEFIDIGNEHFVACHLYNKN